MLEKDGPKESKTKGMNKDGESKKRERERSEMMMEGEGRRDTAG